MEELNRDELPQEKWKKERFESQYIPNYEMSKGSKTYDKLHGIRSGMETLPVTLGGNVLGKGLAGILAAAKSVKSTPATVVKTLYDNGTLSLDDILLFLNQASIPDDFNIGYELPPGSFQYNTDIGAMELTDIGAKQAIKNYKPSSFKENYKEVIDSYNDLSDPSLPKTGSVKNKISRAKKFAVEHPNASSVFKKALGVANVVGNASMSNEAGKLINKLEENWYEPSAKIIYKNVKKYIPEEGKAEIEANGLTPSLWYKWVDPQIQIVDEPKYRTFLTTEEIRDAYDNNEKLDHLPSRPDYWDSLDSKAKLKHIEGWKNLKNKTRRNLIMDIDDDILYNEED